MPARSARWAAWLLLAALWTRPVAVRASTDGTDFWACHLENRDNALTIPFGIVVGNASPVDATVLVSVSTGPLGSVVVPPGQTRSFTFPPVRQVFETTLAPSAYRVTSDVPVSVVQFNPLDDPSMVPSYTADASTLLPAPLLGTTYRVMSWGQQEGPNGEPLRGLLGIIGVADGTTVTVTPSADVLDGFVRGVRAGTPVSFTVGAYDVAQLETAALGDDLTGTLITSDRPIAVFGGATCVRVPDEFGYCDHLEEQLFPTSTWGMQYVLVKSEPRAAEPDHYRVLAMQDGTTFETWPEVTAGTRLAAGEWYEFATDQSFELVASAPVLVGQYFVGRERDPSATIGDPSLMLSVPVEQFDDDQVFLTPSAYQWDYVSLIRRTGRAVTLDGALVDDTAFFPVGASGYEAARVALADGPHRVTGAGGVGVQVYGFDVDVSYAYFGGTRLETLVQPLVCDPGGPYVADCTGAAVVLDATRSSGPGALAYSWSSASPGVVFADPSSAVTEVSVPAPGPATVTLTVTLGAESASCSVEVSAQLPARTAPEGLSEGPPAEWLRVRKDLADTSQLILSFEDRGSPDERVNLYAGTILPTGIVAYDHAPLSCGFVPAPAAPGVGEIVIDAVEGISRYFLISSSHCTAESTRGQRSDGIERPGLPTDCGPL